MVTGTGWVGNEDTLRLQQSLTKSLPQQDAERMEGWKLELVINLSWAIWAVTHSLFRLSICWDLNPTYWYLIIGDWETYQPNRIVRWYWEFAYWKQWATMPFSVHVLRLVEPAYSGKGTVIASGNLLRSSVKWVSNLKKSKWWELNILGPKWAFFDPMNPKCLIENYSIYIYI